jgi:predicted nucleic acid-binding protein
VIVVDTNVLAYRWLPHGPAAAVESLMRSDPEWAAPVLWRSELRNVLAGYLRRGDLNTATAETVMRHAAASLLGGEHFVSDEAVLHLVARSKCSAYDCEFVALAQSLDVPLVTEDKQLLATFPRVCRSLKRFSLDR